MKEPELVTATEEELDEILALAKTSFPLRQYQLLEGVLNTFVYVMLKLQNAKTSIRRFQRMLFGHRTEHKRNVLERAAADPAVQDVTDSVPGLPVPVSIPGPQPSPQRPTRPGHGRNAAQAYSGLSTPGYSRHGSQQAARRGPANGRSRRVRLRSARRAGRSIRKRWRTWARPSPGRRSSALPCRRSGTTAN